MVDVSLVAGVVVAKLVLDGVVAAVVGGDGGVDCTELGRLQMIVGEDKKHCKELEQQEG